MRKRIAAIVPLVLVEALSRIAAYLVALVRPGVSFAVERRARGIYWGQRLGTSGLSIGRHVQIETPNRTSLGRGVTLYCSSHYIAGREGTISIGEGTHIGRFCVFSGLGGISIGRRCAISSHVSIYSVTNDPDAPRPAEVPNLKAKVTVGDDVLMGVNVNILPGVTIGDGAVLGAGAVVTRDVPPGAIVAGAPAKVIRMKEASQS